MIYQILRQLVALALKVYFRKIYLVGASRIPSDQSMVIAANHPMAFCDACLLACFLDRPLHFLVRGDVFVKGWLWFFEATNQIPIYRFRDGFGNMRRNAATFSKVYEKLGQGAAVLIFAEGNTKLQKRLDPLQKGPARIALGAMKDSSVNDLAIVPVGINYTDGTSFRSDVLISIGDAIAVAEYTGREDVKAMTSALTDRIYTELLPHVVHLETPEREALIAKWEQQEYPFRRERVWPILDNRPDRFRFLKGLATRLNRMDAPELQKLSEQLSDPPLRRAHPLRLILFATLVPVMMVGFAVNALPFYLAKWIADKRVTGREFYTPVRIGLSTALMLIYLLVLGVIVCALRCPQCLLLVALIPFWGYLSCLLWEELRNVRATQADTHKAVGLSS